MTAAAPTPPPHLVPVSSVNGDSNQITRGGFGGQARHYAHIKDLVAIAQRRVANHNTASVEELLDLANSALSSARNEISLKRPDFAFVEYIVAQEILSNTVKKNQDFPQVKKITRWEKRYDECLQKVRKSSQEIEWLQKQIEEDNRSSAVVPRVSGPTPDSSSVAQADRRSFAERVHDHPQRTQSSLSTNGHNVLPSDTMTNGHVPRGDRQQTARPDTRSSATDSLTSRFASMRMSAIASPPAEDGRASLESQTSGPSDPRRPSVSIPARLSKDLPKIPSPTYSPAKWAPDETDLKTSQRSRNSITATSDTASLASVTSISYQPYQPNQPNPNGTNRPESAASSRAPLNVTQSRAENRPKETQINAQRLYDHIHQYTVLLIDVRPRDQFDAGHIFGHVLCIEPAALRLNQSAEELQETMVVSPDQESDLFARRNEFDLVVYYDQSTRSTDYLNTRSGEGSPLRHLHDTLCYYNNDRPLKWQPILLVGGLDAWEDLMGPNSLRTSNTVASRTLGPKPARPIARRPPISGPSRLRGSRRTLRDYNPLGPEEEKKWRERARSESVVVQLPEHDQTSELVQDRPPIEAQSTGTVDRFHTRYPDVASVESQVLASRQPARAPPSAPQVPSYPTTPAPTVPSRPPPALARPSYSGVSERSTTQNFNNLRSSELRPYIPPKLLNLPRTGLYNFGVTCYMNATIQCLSATLPLTLFFLDHKWQDYVQEENWKGSKGLMPGMYNTILTNMWRPGEAETIRPTNFRKFCARLNREWGLDRQQDAKEFLDFLVDTLHEDLNVNWQRNPLRALNDKEEAHRERTPYFLAAKNEFSRYTHRDWSKLTELFAGQHISRLECTTCRYTSTTYETFYSISVEIPTSRGRPITLYDCLNSYTTSEMLEGDEVWRCPHCRVDREATKRIIISRAPEYLVIHFKRFSASHTERARKVHTPVDFPLKGLDMSPYMLGPPDGKVAKFIEASYGRDSLKAPPSMQPPYKYDAYAVMRHLGGTMGSGHYIAMVEDKSRARWRQFNDDKIDDFLPEQLSPSHRLQNEQAYIVFYQRVR